MSSASPAPMAAFPIRVSCRCRSSASARPSTRPSPSSYRARSRSKCAAQLDAISPSAALGAPHRLSSPGAFGPWPPFLSVAWKSCTSVRRRLCRSCDLAGRSPVACSLRWRATTGGSGSSSRRSTRAGFLEPARRRPRLSRARPREGARGGQAGGLARRRHALRLRGLALAGAAGAEDRRGRARGGRRSSRCTVELEHWLADEERWDDEPKHETWEEEVLERGLRALGGPGRVRVPRGRRERSRTRSSRRGSRSRGAGATSSSARRREEEAQALADAAARRRSRRAARSSTRRCPTTRSRSSAASAAEPPRPATRATRRSIGYASECAACRVSRAHLLEVAAPARAARMQKIIDQPTKAPPGADGLEAMALRATAWAGEPFLHEDEDPAVVLAPGTARRRALDEATAEIEAGRARADVRTGRSASRSCSGSSACSARSRLTSRPAPSSAATRSTRSPGC